MKLIKNVCRMCFAEAAAAATAIEPVIYKIQVKVNLPNQNDIEILDFLQVPIPSLKCTILPWCRSVD